ncbi:hypothetical protein KY333_00800 [Candidatus Woesearchaeota archaeon]|nr:hypothetical protein [Candidatus Woesearchaeota archaeon]MBW2993945.1 hypothetical protein [Candidatus Woesearchaeota archaeon]
MYTSTNSEYVSTKSDDTEQKLTIVGRISDEKLGELNLVIKTDAQGTPLLHEKTGDTIPMGLAEVNDNETICYFVEKGKVEKTYHWDSAPMSDPETTPRIQLYKSQKLFYNILSNLVETTLWTEILRTTDIDPNTVDAETFEKKINKLCADPENQYLFTAAKSRLITQGFMPVDDSGHAYDLSTCYIPKNLNLMNLMNGLQLDKPKLLKAFRRAYVEKNTARDVTSAKVYNSLNDLKEEQPEVFVGIYNYAVEKGYVQPLLSEIKFNKKQKEFLEKPAIIDTWAEIVLWSERNQKSISEMRHGSDAERKAYHKICTLIQSPHFQSLKDEKPSYPERRKSMFKTARAQKAKAPATIEDKL